MAIVIVRRHFDTIVQQCIDHYPYETGGFIGGKGDLILGIYPVPNLMYFFYKDRTQYMFDEISHAKAARMFSDYGIDLMGIYHSHPESEEPYMSPGDFMADRAYNFYVSLIVSVSRKKDVSLAAHRIPRTSEPVAPGKRALPVPEALKVIEDYEIDEYFTQMDIQKSAAQYRKEEKLLEEKVARILAQKQKDRKPEK